MASRALVSSEAPISFPLFAFFMTVVIAALPRSSSTRPALAGLPAFWLGLGALRVVLAVDGTGDLAVSLGGAPPPPHFLEGTAALLVIGLGSLLWSGAATLRGVPGARVSAGAGIGASLVAGALLVPLWRAVHWPETAAVTAGLVVVALGVWWLAGALRLRSTVLRADLLLGAGKNPMVASGTVVPTAVIGGLAASVGLALIPNTLTLLVGSLVAAVFLHLWFRRLGLVPSVPVLVLTTLGLVPLAWLLLTVAGSAAPSLAALPDAPLSPAAGLWLTPWLLLAAWGLLGQWPLQSLVPPPMLALVAGVLLIRVGVAAIPDGLLGFQAAVAPVVVLSLCWAVATGRGAMGLSALGLFGAIAVPERGATWLLLVFGAASLTVVAERLRATPRFLLDRGIWLLAAVGVWPALEAGLRTQVVYTVLCAAALAAAGGWSAGEAGPHGSER